MKLSIHDILLAIVVIVVLFSALMLGELVAPARCAEYVTYVRGDC